MKIIEMLHNLKAVSKRTEKEKLLEEYLADLEFRAVVIAALDPRKMYYIKELPEPTEGEYTTSLPTALGILPSLTEREITGNDALNTIALTLGSMNPDDREVFSRVLLKDLKCGVGLKTVNKVWGSELIYDHPYMSYHAYNDKNMKRIKYPAYIQTKLDGLYIDMIFHKEEGTLDFMTRAGNYLDIPDVITGPIFNGLSEAGFTHGVFQGEGLIVKGDGYMDRKESNGVFYSHDGLKEQAKDVRFVFWDVIPYDDFQKKKCDVAYQIRFSDGLSNLIDIPYCEAVETIQVFDEEEAYEIYSTWLAEGKEGAVLKNMNLVWKDGKAPGGVKMKAVREADLLVTGWNPGEGKYKQGIGSLICETSDVLLQVHVAGMSDAQRGVEAVKVLGNITGYKAIEGFDKDQYNGKILPVIYNEIIENEAKPGLYSLFLPRVQKVNGEIVFRTDKLEADSLDDLREKEKGG